MSTAKNKTSALFKKSPPETDVEENNSPQQEKPEPAKEKPAEPPKAARKRKTPAKAEEKGEGTVKDTSNERATASIKIQLTPTEKQRLLDFSYDRESGYGSYSDFAREVIFRELEKEEKILEEKKKAVEAIRKKHG
eukprot:Anaeramoba_flamelloidesa569223_43.p2 GENE.a569223_43~~a569223_43.p2  ORF type:complete len:136 (+),score=23.03 a569223_43:675-1082(+)